MFRITVRIPEYRLSIISSHSTWSDGFDRGPTLRQLPRRIRNSAASRAASIARAAMIFRQQLKQGLIKPDTIKGTPLCMDNYR